MGTKRVVITGVGVICPVGNDAPSAWEALISGRSGTARTMAFDASEIKSQVTAEIKDFDPVSVFGSKEARRMDRYTQVALVAAQEALTNAGLAKETVNTKRVGVVLGSGIGGVNTTVAEAVGMIEKGSRFVSPYMVPMMLPDTAPGRIAIDYGFRGPNMNIATACASGTNAIGEATAMIKRGAADIMITGGSEAGLNLLTVAGFANMGALTQLNDEPERASRPFDKTRDGFVPGEGAGILVLESEEHASARGATIIGEVLGYGSSADAYHITAPHETGEGAILSMEAALLDAGITTEQVDYLNAHGTSTPLNDKAETIAIKSLFGEQAYNLAISSTKSMTGHLLGAGGAVEAIFCLYAIQTGQIPPTINYEIADPDCDLNYTPNSAIRKQVDIAMSNSFGFGGHNASIVIGRYKNGAG